MSPIVWLAHLWSQAASRQRVQPPLFTSGMGSQVIDCGGHRRRNYPHADRPDEI